MNTRHASQPPRRTPAPALPRGARWAARLILVVPLLAFLTATGFYGAALLRLLRASVTPVVAGEVGRQIGHETRIGRIGYLTPGRLTLDDVAIAREATFARSRGKTLATAKRITLHYNLAALALDSGNAAHALGDIVVAQPDLFVERFSSKKFNFSDILQPKQKRKQKPFVGQVIVQDGVLRFQDDLAPADPRRRPAYNTLTRVNGTVNLHSERIAYFALAGRGTQGRVATLTTRGDASRVVAGRFRLTLDAADADAAYWVSYFPVKLKARVIAGRADLNLSLTELKKTPLPDVQGRVAVRQAAVVLTGQNILRQPVRQIAGSATFTGHSAQFQAVGALAGQLLQAQGTVANFQKPQLAVTGTLGRLDPARLAAAIPAIRLPSGLRVTPGTAQVQVVGSVTNPVITAQAVIPAVTYQGNAATDVRAQVTYANRVLSVPTATFAVNNAGRVTLQGTVDTTPKTPLILLSGRAQGVDLARLRLPVTPATRGLNLAGVGEAAFIADNRGRPLTVTANIAVARPHARQTTAQALRGRVTYAPGHDLTIARAVVEDPNGLATVSGRVPLSPRDGQWNLAVNAAGIELARWLRPYTTAAVGGQGYFQGHIVGPQNAPQAQGRVQLYGGRYGRYAADAVSGSVRAGAGGVRLSDVVLRRYPTEARVSGAITQLASKNPALDLNVSVAQGDVQDFVTLAGQAAPDTRAAALAGQHSSLLSTLTGTARGTLHIAGRAQNPAIAGRASITDATAGGYRVDEASAGLNYRNGTLRLSGAVVRGEGVTLTASGQWQYQTGRLQAIFAGSDLNLARLDYLTHPYADITGSVNFSGALGGTLKSPALSLGVVADNLSVDGQKFAPFNLFGSYEDGVLSQTGDPWRFTLLPPVTGAAPIQYVVSALKVTLPVPAHPRREPTLALTAEIPESAPETVTHLAATLRHSRFAATPAGQNLVARLDALPQPLAGTLALPALTVSGPLRAPRVQATLAASGLAAGGNTVRRLTLQGTFQGGPSPSATVSRAGADDITVSQVPINSVRLVNARYTREAVSADSLDVRSGTGYLHATGAAGLSKTGTLEASLDASNVPVALFKTFFSQSKLLAGQVQGFQISNLTVNARGATRAPELTASVNLDKPRVPILAKPTGGAPPPSLADTAVDSVRSGVITLAPPAAGGPPVLTVSNLTAYKAGRPVAFLSGTLPVQWGASVGALPSLPAGQSLRAQLLVQNLAAFAFLVPSIDPKKTAGTLTATLETSGAPDLAHLSGTLNLDNASLGLTDFDTSLQKVNGLIVLRNGRLTVQSLAAQSSKGGTLTAGGGATLAGGGDANLRLTARDLTVDETGSQNLLSRVYQSGGRGRLNGAVAITGPWRTLRIATPDPLRLTDALITIPQPTAPSGRIAQISVNQVGPTTRSNSSLLGLLTQRVGDAYDADRAERDRQALLSTRYFQGPVKLSVSADPAVPGAVDVVYTVSELADQQFDPQFALRVALGGAGKLVTFRSTLLRADANGNVAVTGSLDAPQLRAHLNVQRGQFILISNRLKFVPNQGGTPGTIDVSYPGPASGVPGAPPVAATRVDLTAQTTVSLSPATLAASASAVPTGTSEAPPTRPVATSATGNNFNASQRYVITVHITGPLNDFKNLTLEPSSSPPGLTTAQMYAALGQQGALNSLLAGGTGAESALKQQLAQALTNVALPALLSPLETGIAQTFGLTDFSVDYSPDAPLQVSLSKELAPRLSVTYNRYFGARTPGPVSALTQPLAYELKLSYGLTRRLQVSVSTDDQRNNTAALEGVFGF